MESWDTVSGTPEFNALPVEQKASVRNAFFDREVAPKAPPEHLDQVRQAFLARTDDSLTRTRDIGGFPAKRAEDQDSGSFWKEQGIKGLSQIPELSATIGDLLNNYGPAHLGRLLKGETSKSDMAGEYRKATRDTGLIKDIPPTTEAQRIFAKPVEFAAASLPFSAGNIGMSAGRRGVTALTEALSTVGGAEGAEVGERAGRELGGSGGAAGGAMAGGLVGGGVSAMAVPQVAARGYDAAKKGLSRLFQFGTGGRKLTEEQLNDIIGPKLANVLKTEPGAAEALAESAKVADKVPGFKPDLAASTGSRVIGAMKERVSREGEDVLGRFERLSANNKRALAEFEEKAFPKGAGDRPQDIAKKRVASSAADLEAYGKKTEEALSRQIAETDAAIESFSKAYERAPSNTAIGERLTELQAQSRQLAFKQAEAQYFPVYDLADRMGFQEDIAPLVDYVKKTMRDEGQFFQRGDMPTVFRDILKFAKGKEKEVERKTMNLAFKGDVPPGITQFASKHGGLSKAQAGGEMPDMENLPKGLSTGIQRLVHGGKNAKNPDAMRELMVEAGYLPQEATLNDMYRLMDEEFRAAAPTHFSSRDVDRAGEIMRERAFEKSPEFLELAQEGAKREVPVSFREFHSLLKRVNEDAGQAAQRGWKGQWLNDLKTQLKGRLDNAGGDQQLGDELRKANDFWLEQWKKPFVKGAGGLMQRERVPAENIVQNAFLKRGERGAEDWKRIYVNTPEAGGLLREGTADSFVRAAMGKDDRMDVGKAKGWLKANDSFLKAFPELRQDFADVTGSVQRATVEGAEKAGALETKLSAIKQAKNELQKSELAKVSRAEDTGPLVASAIGSPKEMQALLNITAGNPQARQGLAHEIAESVLTKGNPEAYMLAHSDTLKKAFDTIGPGHWDNLQAIIKGDQILERGGDPSKLGKVGMEADPMQAMLGTPSSSLFSLAKGLGSWVSPEYALFHVAGRYAFKVRADQQREFLVEMLTNPDVAKRLAATYKDVTPQTAEEMAKGLYNQGSREAMEQLRKIKEEIEPMMRLHGIRVSVNAANVPGREEYQQRQDQSEQERTRQGVQAGGQRRLRQLQGGMNGP